MYFLNNYSIRKYKTTENLFKYVIVINIVIKNKNKIPL